MAVQSFATGNNQTVKQWARGVEVEALPRTSFAAIMGKRKDSALEVRDELQGKPGDRIRTALRVQDTTVMPNGADSTLEGNESTNTYYTDDIFLDSSHAAHRWRKYEHVQRINHNEREEAKFTLADRVAHNLDSAFFNQVAGITAHSATTLGGNNTVTAPTSGDHFWVDDANNSADEDLASGDDFSLSAVDVLVEQAKTRVYPIQPAWIPAFGTHLYVLFIHPYQVSQLRSSSSLWQNINRDRLSGGDIANNPLLTGALGIYNGTLLVESNRVPTGRNSSSAAEIAEVRRAIFCGSQAASICWGRAEFGTPNKFVWDEESFNYGLEAGIGVHMVFGLKRLDYNSRSFGSLVLSTYSTSSNA